MRELITTTLIIRFSSVGDIILTTPLVRALRRTFPDSRIDFLVKSEHADLLRGNPHVSRVIAFDAASGLQGLRRVREQIRRTGYDRILDLHDNVRSRIVTAGQQGVRRYSKRKFARFVLLKFHRDIYRWFGTSPGVSGWYLETVRDLGVADDGEGPELFPSAEDVSVADALLPASPAGWLGICPSARHQTKIWPAERFAFAGSGLAARHALGVILLGGPEDVQRCEDVAARIREQSPGVTTVNAAAKLTLLQSAALLDRCVVVLTNDSGLMHVASARKRPLVAIFGSTVRPLGFAPYGEASRIVERQDLGCRPCTAIGRRSCPAGHFRCMLDISGADVMAAASSLIRT